MKLQSIQIMRAVAVLLVVVHHVRSVPVGAAGVDLFFVISGFIIATIAPQERPVRFLAKRAARIYPIYWVCQAPYLAYALLTSQLTLKLTVASLTLIPFGMVARPALGVGWTLMFEVYFYLAAAASLALKDIRPAVIAFSLFYLGNAATGNPALGFLGHPLIIEFIAGALIAVAPRNPRFAIGGLIVAALVLVPVIGRDMPWAWTYAQSADQSYRVVFWGLPALALVYAGVVFERKFQGYWWKPAVILGDASYSIYLTHTAVVALAFWWPAAILLSILVGLAVHFWIEKPLVQAATKHWVTRPGTAEHRPSASA